MARAGKGLSYRLPERVGGGDEDCGGRGSEEEVEKEVERPFEPLCVWQSPHNGGEALGLPARM